MTRLDLFDPCFLTPPSTLLLFLYTTMSLNNRFSLIRSFPFVFDESHSLPTDSLRGGRMVKPDNTENKREKERRRKGEDFTVYFWGGGICDREITSYFIVLCQTFFSAWKRGCVTQSDFNEPTLLEKEDPIHNLIKRLVSHCWLIALDIPLRFMLLVYKTILMCHLKNKILHLITIYSTYRTLFINYDWFQVRKEFVS